MRFLPNPGVRAVLVLCSVAGLTACGYVAKEAADDHATSVGQSVGSAIGQAISCIPSGCAYSSTLASSDITPRYTVSTGGSSVVANATFFGKPSGIFLNYVQLDTDQVTAGPVGSPEVAMASDPAGIAWSTTFPSIAGSRAYSITLNRRDGSKLSSVVTVPAAFTIVSPPGPLVLNRSSSVVPITVSTPSTEPLQTYLSGSCGTTQVQTSVAFAAPTASASGSTYALDPVAFRSQLLAAGYGGSSATSQCTLVLALRREAQGTISPLFKSGGSMVGRYEQTLGVQFDLG